MVWWSLAMRGAEERGGEGMRREVGGRGMRREGGR